MKTCSSFLVVCLQMVFAQFSFAESPAHAFSPQTVVIDHFEARDARLSDAIEALSLLAEQATDHAWQPTMVLFGDGVGSRKVSVKLDHPTLAAVLDQMAKSANLEILYGKNSVAISGKKG